MAPEKVQKLYTKFQIFFSLLLWVPIYYEYQRRSGLSDGAIFQIQSVYYLAFCLLEIPTGMVADLFGRKLCMQLGSFTLIVANLWVVWDRSYFGFMASFLLIAVSRSLISGAASAYLFDELKSHGREAEYRTIEGKARAYGLLVKVFGWMSAGWLMEWNLSSPYWLTAMASALGLWYASQLPAQVLMSSRNSFIQKLRAMGGSVVTVSRSPYLMFLIAQGVVIFVLARVAQIDVFQPLLKEKGLGPKEFGWVMALMSLCEAMGSYWPDRMKRLMGPILLIDFASFVCALFALSAPWLLATGTVLFYFVCSYLTGMVFPIQKQLVNEAITDSSVRATILSVESIVDRAVCAVMAWVLSLYMAKGDLHAFMTHIGALSIGVVVTLWFIGLFGQRFRTKMSKALSLSSFLLR